MRDGASPCPARFIRVGSAAAPVTLPAQRAAAASGVSEMEVAAALPPALAGGGGTSRGR